MLFLPSPFDTNNTAIAPARQLVSAFVAEVEAQGILQQVALNQGSYAIWLAGFRLSIYIRQDRIKLCMIERWLMEAIARQAQERGLDETTRG